MSEASPRRFVIVGGGTAGWVAALPLQKAVAKPALNAVVTVVESSRIPTIGVGEGTMTVFRQMLKHLGFDEFEFLRETQARIKFGIRCKDWRSKGHSYDGPIDDPYLVVEPSGMKPQSDRDIFSCAAGRRLADTHLFPLCWTSRKRHSRAGVMAIWCRWAPIIMPIILTRPWWGNICGESQAASQPSTRRFQLRRAMLEQETLPRW
jgi:hypothetical protein